MFKLLKPLQAPLLDIFEVLNLLNTDGAWSGNEQVSALSKTNLGSQSGSMSHLLSSLSITSLTR